MRHTLALVLLVACSASPALSPRGCTPGATVACACPGASGVQTCGADGTLGACVCADGGIAEDARPAAVDAPSAPDVGADAGMPILDAPGPQDRPQGPDAADVMDARAHADASADSGPTCDVSSDPMNCGGCGRVCTGQLAVFRCVSGVCAVDRCEPGWLDCDRISGNGCETEALSNRNNCGACGVRCAATERCERGACTGCACATNERCVGGACTPCPTGMTVCANACVDTQTDRNNCGACGVRCPSPTGATVVCAAGACTVTSCAVEGDANCDNNPANGCEASLSSNGHCGACNRPCPTGMTCGPGRVCACANSSQLLCGGACVSVGPSHCGACGRACADNEFCGLVSGSVSGCISCGVEQPSQRLRRCDNRCVDINSDNANCGACGVACTGSRACFSGVCR